MTYNYEMGDIIDITDTESQAGGLRIRHIVAFEKSDLIQLAIGAIVVTLVSTLVGGIASRIVSKS